MSLPEYVQTWLTGFDESSEPVDCSMISLILYTRLAEPTQRRRRLRSSDEVLEGESGTNAESFLRIERMRHPSQFA